MFKYDAYILVTDDMMGMRKYVIKQLKSAGFNNFVEATDGAVAWNILQESEKPIELILSDVNMPNMTGIELLKKVRASEKYKDVPFLLVTAETESKTKEEADSAGVTDYLIKPFKAEDLKEKFQKIESLLDK